MNPCLLEIYSYDLPREAQCGDCGAAAEERVEDGVAFVGGGEEDAFQEGEGLLGGVLAEFFLAGVGRRIGQTDFICLPPASCFMSL